jgi:hypothetical protein
MADVVGAKRGYGYPRRLILHNSGFRHSLRINGARMLPLLAADAVLVFHLAFILFSALGALLALKWRWILLLQLPAAAWGFFVEYSGRICPLTQLENYFRHRAGQAGYGGGFVEHYLVATIYPNGLTREIQFVLASIVVATNFSIYGWLLMRRLASRKTGA